MANILYCFLCHRGTQPSQFERIREMMSCLKASYVFCIGGKEDTASFNTDSRELHMPCDDSYAGLPAKVLATFAYLTTATEFSEFTHYMKLDEDMQVLKLFPKIMFPNYAGRVYHGEGNRKWHVGRCPGSHWNTRPYDGIFVPWCLGGYSYMLSRTAATTIVEATKTNIPDEIYEDLMIAKILNAVGIHPVNIPKLSDYISPI
jgi:hypothetical protein